MQLNSRTLVRHVALLAVVPALLVILYAANPVWRIQSDHGFMHQGIVYSILNGAVPPQSPILGGYALLYPWAHHYIVAIIAGSTNLPLSWTFAGLNVLSLCLALLFAHVIGYRLSGKPATGLFAALLAVVSCNIMTRGPFVELLKSTLPLVGFDYMIWEYKALVIAKFYNMNSNGLGIAAVLGWLSATILYLESGRRVSWTVGVIAAAASAVAFLYPVYTLNIALTMIILFGLSLHPALRLNRISVLVAGVSSAAGFLAAVPYLIVVSGGRRTAAFGITHDIPWFLQKGVMLACALAVAAILIFFARDSYRSLLRTRSATLMLLIIFAVVSAASWLVLSQSGTEYKHLLICTVVAGLLAAPAMTSLYERGRLVALVAMGLLLTPFLGDWADLMNTGKWPAYQAVVEDGATLRHPDPSEEQMYQWIRDHTTVRDTFVDDQLLMPVLGQRSLYFGPDYQTQALRSQKAQSGKEVADGWEWRPEDLVAQQGYDPAVIARRKQVVEDMLRRGADVQADAVPEGAALYLVARSAGLRELLRRKEGVEKVFTSRPADIYRLNPGRSAGVRQRPHRTRESA